MPTNASRAGERTRGRSHVSCPSVGSAVGCCSFPVPLAPQGCPLPLTMATGASNGANVRGVEERKVDGYWRPLGYRQVPGQCHPHPVPHGGGPRGLSLSLPRPGCPHCPRLFLTTKKKILFRIFFGFVSAPKTRPFPWKRCVSSLPRGEGRREGFLIFFQMKDDGPIWKRKGMW